MSKITFIDNEYVTLWYYPEHRILHHQFHKYIYGQPFREMLMKGVEIFEEYGADKWLSDDRNNSALPKDDVEWGAENWFPRVKAAGWKYWALVMPEIIFGQMNMKRLSKRYGDQGITVKAFTDPDEALAWLESWDDPEKTPPSE